MRIAATVPAWYLLGSLPWVKEQVVEPARRENHGLWSLAYWASFLQPSLSSFVTLGKSITLPSPF